MAAAAGAAGRSAVHVNCARERDRQNLASHWRALKTIVPV